MKILHPHGEVSKEELAEILELAIEGRRRVKEQLKKMGSFEYYHTSFSYATTRPARRSSSACPSRAGATSSPPIRWRPGTVYTARRHVRRHGGPLPRRGVSVSRHRQAQARRRRERAP
jgi:ATP-dependent Lon protease